MASPAPPSTIPRAERIHILGAGNLGQYLARGLTRQDPLHPVTLLFHRPGLLHDWESAGSVIECETSGQIDHTTGIAVELIGGDGAGAGADDSSKIKNLIVACKTYMTVPALQRVRNRLDQTSTIVFLQNGMGTTEEVTKELFPSVSSRPAYWAGICVLGVSSTKPFSIVPTGIGNITLGPVGSALSSSGSAADSSPSQSPSNFMIQQLVQTQDPSSTVVTPAELRRAQILKLVANAIINPLTTILGCKNAQLLDQESTIALIKVLIEEAGPVVRALLPPHSTGSENDTTAFSDEKLLEYVLMVIRKTATNTSSMLQDARSGKRTEIDYINGFIASQGERMGHSCPNHAVAVSMIQKRESLGAEHLESRFKFK